MKYGDGPCSSLINISNPVAQDRGGRSDTTDTNGLQKVSNFISAVLLCFLLQLSVFVPVIFMWLAYQCLLRPHCCSDRCGRGYMRTWSGQGKLGLIYTGCHCHFGPIAFSVVLFCPFADYSKTLWKRGVDQMWCFVNLNQTWTQCPQMHNLSIR